MSYHESGLIACRTLQTELDQAWDSGNWEKPHPMALAEFVSTNPQRINPVINPGNGKTVTAEFTHFQRYLEDDFETVTEYECSTEKAVDQASNIYELDITNKKKVGRYIDAESLATWCGSNPELFQRTVQSLINQMDVIMANQQADKVAELYGKWGADVPDVTDDVLSVATKVSGDWNPEAIEEIDFALLQTQYDQMTTIFGGRDLYAYYRHFLAGCCANSGINLEEMWNLYGRAVVYDHRLAAAMIADGNADSLSIQAGALQWLNYTRGTWREGVNEANIASTANYVMFPVESPRLGLSYDMIIKDECPGKVSMMLYGISDTVVLPANLYREGDRLYGSNGVNAIEVDNT